MRLSAIQRAGDAIDYTRVYLLGQTLRRYVILALIAIFLGPAGVSGPPGPVQLQRDVQHDLQEASPELDQLLGAITLEVVLVIVVTLGAIAGIYLLLSAFMEFAFVHSLVHDTVEVRAPAGRHWRQALALFAFRAVVWGAVSVSAVVAGLAIFGHFDSVGTDSPIIWTGLVFALGIVAYLSNRLTTDFVVPIMLLQQVGLFRGWARFVEVGRSEWRQYGAYVPIRVILEIAIGIVFAIVVAIYLVAIVVVIGLPLGFVFGVVLGLSGVLLVVGILAIVAVVGMAGLIVPFHTYLRYYSLLVLSDTDPRLDLVGAVRSRLTESIPAEPEAF